MKYITKIICAFLLLYLKMLLSEYSRVRRGLV